MKNLPLKFAVIGIGSIAGHHIKSIQELPHCELVAICSSNPMRANEAAAKYGVAGYADFRQMFQNEDIDVVNICTVSGQHLDPTIAAAKAGIHVIVEKPLEITVARAQQMIDICRKANVQLSCIFQNRYASDYKKMKAAVDNGLLGKIVLANAYIKWFRSDEYYSSRPWRGTFKGDGGAALINQSIHTIDLLQNLLGAVNSIYGKIKTTTHDIEGEDLGVAMLEFKNGAIGTIEGSTSAYPGYPEKLAVYGENGSIVLEGGQLTAWNIKGHEIPNLEKDNAVAVGAADPMAIDFALHKAQIEEIAQSLLNNEQAPISGEDGLKALRIIEGIYESSKKGKEVYLG